MFYYLNCDEISLNSEVKLAMVLLHLRVILAEVNGTKSHLDLSNLPFALYNLADLAKICILRTKDYYFVSELKSALIFTVC